MEKDDTHKDQTLNQESKNGSGGGLENIVEHRTSRNIIAKFSPIITTIYRVGVYSLAGCLTGFVISRGDMETAINFTEYATVFGLAKEGGFEIPKTLISMGYGVLKKRIKKQTGYEEPGEIDDEESYEEDETEDISNPIYAAVGGAVSAAIAWYVIDIGIDLMESWTGINPVEICSRLINTLYNYIAPQYAGDFTYSDLQWIPVGKVACIGGTYGVLQNIFKRIKRSYLTKNENNG